MNRIWKDRVVNVGYVSARQAQAWGFSGVMLRGSGVLQDLRITQPYEVYDEIDFKIPIGQNGCLLWSLFNSNWRNAWKFTYNWMMH